MIRSPDQPVMACPTAGYGVTPDSGGSYAVSRGHVDFNHKLTLGTWRREANLSRPVHAPNESQNGRVFFTMNEHVDKSFEVADQELMNGRVSRAQLLAGLGVGLVAGLLPTMAPAEAAAAGAPGVLSFPFFPPVTGTYTTEAIMDIFKVLLTASYLRATLVTSNILTGRVIPIPNEPAGSQLGLRIAQADAAIEQYHIDFWSSYGATPITTTFTRTAADAATLEARQHVHVAMYMAAVREFAELGQPTLAKWAFQAGAIEAEDRAIFRFLQALSGNATGNPPNNKSFETDLILYVRDALDAFKALGLIAGTGQPVVYPGRTAVLAAAGAMANTLLQKIPNDAGSTVVLTSTGTLIGERT